MEANGLLTGYTHLLTGYIGSESFLDIVMEVARKLKASTQRLWGGVVTYIFATLPIPSISG